MIWRHATLEDSGLLADLNRQLIADEGHHNPMDLAQLEARMRAWLQSEYQAVLFYRSDQLAAYALWKNDEWNRVCLRQFFVVRALRRQGIGRKAIESFRSEVVPAGKKIILEVLTENAAGRAFWAAVGFREYAITLQHVSSNRESQL